MPLAFRVNAAPIAKTRDRVHRPDWVEAAGGIEMRVFSGIAAAVLLSTAAVGQPAATILQVELGPTVAARSGDLGRTELEQQRAYLRSGVQRLIARRKNPPASIHLVIADIEPNRPTSAQLGQSAQLNPSSFGLGGAAITGEVVLSDGRHLPLRYRFFQTQLANETSFTTWGDADEAFDTLAGLIATGHVPDDPGAWPPPHVAHAMTGTRIPG